MQSNNIENDNNNDSSLNNNKADKKLKTNGIPINFSSYNTSHQNYDEPTSDLTTNEKENSLIEINPFIESEHQIECKKIKLDSSNSKIENNLTVLNIPFKKIRKILSQKLTGKSYSENKTEDIRNGVNALMELFIEKCVENMTQRNRKTLTIEDLKFVANKNEEFRFLKDLFD